MEKTSFEKFTENVGLALDIILAFVFIVLLIYNLYMGIAYHDTYYLAMSIIDYGFIKINTKNIATTLDIEI